MLSFSLNANNVPYTGTRQLGWFTRNLEDLRGARTRRLDRRTAEAIDRLAHAIEYLEDTMPLLAEETTRTQSTAEAILLLKTLNRSVLVGGLNR